MRFLTALFASFLLIGGAFAQQNYQPAIQSNRSGFIVSVWGNNDDGSMQAATYSNGVWSDWVTIPNTYGAYASPPFLVVDSTGNALVVWADYNSTEIRASALPFGGSWSDPVSISPTADYGSYSTTPDISINGSGGVLAVWSNIDTGNVQAAHLHHIGGHWSHFENLD